MASPHVVADYKVGIICALPKERTAVEAMLDEIHDVQLDTPGDNNVYTFGSFVKEGIVRHNIVVASLGKGSYGVVSAAQVAGDMRRSFPHLKYGLMVGIAGAMARPDLREADIRLGDIVVGCANGVPSIIDYSRGKDTADGFDIRSELADPPEALSRVVSALESRHQRLGPTYLVHLANMLKKHERYNNPRWQHNYYNRPDAADILFDSRFDGCKGEEDCGACLIAGQMDVVRQPRDLPPPPADLASEKFIRISTNGSVDYPIVFLGSIGSAHTLMKSSVSRDRVFQTVKDQRKAELLCFEMEASGMVRDWPCLVIRGICDYADAHKNDVWQNFAAATAAAYAKDLLLLVTSADVEHANPINKVVQDGQTLSASTSRAYPERFENSNRTDRHQVVSHVRPNDTRLVLPPMNAQEQLELNRQLINAAGAGNLDLVKSLHRRGADINSSDGPRWTPTAIDWATGGYMININTMQRFPGRSSTYVNTELKKYRAVIRYLYENGLNWEEQQPKIQSIISQALTEDQH